MVTKLDPTTDKGNCLICDREVMWVTKSYGGKFPDKKTLRNADDQQAHNVKDNQGGWTCSSVTGNTQSVGQQLTETKVIWEDPGELTEKEETLLGGLIRFRALAYKDAKDVHPDMNENSNIFGQIVNAGITHLTQLAKVMAIKEIKS